MSTQRPVVASSQFLSPREQTIVRKCFDGTCPCLERHGKHESEAILDAALTRCRVAKSEIESFEWLFKDRLERIQNGPPKVKDGWKPPDAPGDGYSLEAFHDGDEWILCLTSETDVIDVEWPFETNRAWDVDLKKLGFAIVE